MSSGSYQKGFAFVWLFIVILLILGLISGGVFIFKHIGYKPGPMTIEVRELCDLNLDGKCTEDDKKIFRDSLGKCQLAYGSFEKGYHPLADEDLDGCVTDKDYDWLFGGK